MSLQPAFTNLTTVQAVNQRVPLVGFTVFWRLAGLRVQRDQLALALDQTGWRAFLPDPPSPRVALRRALQRWIAARQATLNAMRTIVLEEDEADESADSSTPQRTLIRVINRPGSEHLVFALIAENVDFASLGLSYGTALRILLHKVTGEMIVTTEASGRIEAVHESQQLAAQLQPYWQDYRELYIARDLSQMMRAIVASLHATSLRQAGGVYFVPITQKEPVERLRATMKALPRLPDLEPFVCALGVPDTKEDKRGLVQAVHAGLMDELHSLRTDLHHLQQAGTKVRAQTVAQRMLSYRQMKGKAELYSDLLGLQQEAVRAAVEAMENEAQQLLTGDAPRIQARAVAPSLFNLSMTSGMTSNAALAAA